MRKQIYLILAFLVTASTSLQAVDVLTEVKGAYFYPTDKLFRDVYPGNAQYGLELSSNMWDVYYFWLGFDYFYGSGHLTDKEHHTTIQLVPITFGVKYIYPLSHYFDIYAGIGCQIEYLKLRNKYPQPTRMAVNWGAGGIAKLGLIYTMDSGFFVDLFTNFAFEQNNFHEDRRFEMTHHRADVSGFAFGIGIGYRFNDYH